MKKAEKLLRSFWEEIILDAGQKTVDRLEASKLLARAEGVFKSTSDNSELFDWSMKR